MGKTKSLVEEIFDDFVETYAESNRVALDWMEREYLEHKKQENAETTKTDNLEIKQDQKTQEFCVKPNDGDTQIDSGLSH
jgi:hypothetical protein